MVLRRQRYAFPSKHILHELVLSLVLDVPQSQVADREDAILLPGLAQAISYIAQRPHLAPASFVLASKRSLDKSQMDRSS